MKISSFVYRTQKTKCKWHNTCSCTTCDFLGKVKECVKSKDHKGKMLLANYNIGGKTV